MQFCSLQDKGQALPPDVPSTQLGVGTQADSQRCMERMVSFIQVPTTLGESPMRLVAPVLLPFKPTWEMRWHLLQSPHNALSCSLNSSPPPPLLSFYSFPDCIFHPSSIYPAPALWLLMR